MPGFDDGVQEELVVVLLIDPRTVADGRIELNFDVDPNDPDQGPLGEMTWVLVPVR